MAGNVYLRQDDTTACSRKHVIGNAYQRQVRYSNEDECPCMPMTVTRWVIRIPLTAVDRLFISQNRPWFWTCTKSSFHRSYEANFKWLQTILDDTTRCSLWLSTDVCQHPIAGTIGLLSLPCELGFILRGICYTSYQRKASPAGDKLSVYIKCTATVRYGNVAHGKVANSH